MGVKLIWAMPQRRLPSLEGFLEGGPTSVASMDARLQAHCIGLCRHKTTYCAREWVFTRFYKARLFGSATFNICLVALDGVVFLGLLKFHPNAAPSDINKAEIRRG